MIQKLVVFGDSWAYGDELSDPRYPDAVAESPQQIEYRLQKCFGGLVAKHFNLDFENQGFPGNSLYGTMMSLLWYLENCNYKNTLFLFCLTCANRHSWFNNNSLQFDSSIPAWKKLYHSTWINSIPDNFPNEIVMLNKLWVNNILSDDSSKVNYLMAVNFIDGLCHKLQIPFLRFDVFPPPLVPKFCESEFKFCLDEYLLQFQEVLRKPRGHPNELGHEFIAQHLISHIKSVKMLT